MAGVSVSLAAGVISLGIGVRLTNQSQAGVRTTAH
jgi:hypothetical protein